MKERMTAFFPLPFFALELDLDLCISLVSWMNLMDDMVTDSSLNVTVKRNHRIHARIMFSHVQFGQKLIGRLL